MDVLYADTCLSYIKSVAGRNGVSIVWEDAAQPRTNGSIVWLPRISSTMSKEELDRLRLFVKHETSHCKWSDFAVVNEWKPKGLFMFLANLLEDHRIDYLNDSQFSGDRALTCAFLQDYYNSAHTEEPVNTLFMWDAEMRQSLYPTLDLEGMPVENVLRNKLLPFNDDLRIARCIEDATEGTTATLELAKRILEEVFGATPEECEAGGEEEEGEGDEQGEGSGKGEKSEGHDTSDKGGEKEGEGEEEGEEGEGDAGDEDTGRRETLTREPSTMYAPHEGDATTECIEEEGRGYKPYAVTNLLTSRDIGKHRMLTGGHELAERLLNSMLKKSNMHNVLRQKLQVISKARTVYGQKRGKLHSSSLFKVGVDSPSKDRIFSKKVETEALDVAVTLLMDCSGSMYSDHKYTHACAAVLLLKDVFSTLNIPLEMLGFTDDGHNHVMYEMQKFGENVPKNTLIEMMKNIVLLDNADGESILYAHNRLLQRREKRRILIVLSDGEPCGGRGNGCVKKYTRQVINAIEARSPIELLGVGLLHDGVQDWYSKYVIIPSATTIESSLISVVERRVFSI